MGSQTACCSFGMFASSSACLRPVLLEPLPGHAQALPRALPRHAWNARGMPGHCHGMHCPGIARAWPGMPGHARASKLPNDKRETRQGKHCFYICCRLLHHRRYLRRQCPGRQMQKAHQDYSQRPLEHHQEGNTYLAQFEAIGIIYIQILSRETC